MDTLTIDCAGVEDEDAFWERYLQQIDTEGSGYFGRNLNAFRDALYGGPGWPGEVRLEFLNSASLRHLSGGKFLDYLHEIAKDQELVSITFR